MPEPTAATSDSVVELLRVRVADLERQQRDAQEVLRAKTEQSLRLEVQVRLARYPPADIANVPGV